MNKMALGTVALSIGLVGVAGMLCHGCYNKGITDLHYSFKYAEVKLPSGGVMKGKVDRWWDWENSDTVQVKFSNGVIVYTHMSNVLLFNKEPKP